MALTNTIELNESWQFRETGEGQEFIRIFYAIWADVFNLRGASYELPAIGDPIPDSVFPDREDLRVINIVASPRDEDVDGCRVEVTYSNISKETLPKNVPDSRLSWQERFYSVMEVKSVTRAYSGGTYTGADLSHDSFKDADGTIIPQPVYVPSFIYDLTVSLSFANLDGLTDKLGKINSDELWTTRQTARGTRAMVDKQGNYIFSGSDQKKWLFSNLNVVRQGADIYEVNMEFMYNHDGWNQDSGGHNTDFYGTTTLSDLFNRARDEDEAPQLGGSR